MIRIDFDPKKIPGSLLLLSDDLKDPSALAIKLRDEKDPLSKYLKDQLSTQTQLLNSYDGSAPLPAQLQSAIIEGLNQQLSDPSLFSKEHFQGIELERDTLIKPLAQQKPQGEELLRFNRLLLEDAYPKEIVKSPKAEWDAWNSLAEKAKENVIEQWEKWKQSPGASPEKFKPKWEQYIWKGIRSWLLKYVFHNKCAYCETPGVGYIPDAEHFRPKGQVRTKSGIVKTFDVDGRTEITHPGYFWLAYHWLNLLPSCNTCNRYGGKKDIFPAKKHVAVRRMKDDDEIGKLRHQRTRSTTDGYIFYLEPEDLDVIEERHLIHPYLDKPENEIYFELDGMATPRNNSQRGEESIKVYSLNEPSKVDARHRAQDDDVERYVTRVLAARSDPIKMKMAAREIRNEYYKGGRPYGAAVFDYIRHYVGKTPLDPEVLLEESRPDGASS